MTTCTDGASAHTGRHCKNWQPFIFDPAQTAATKCLCPLTTGIRRQLTEAYTRQPRLPMPAGNWRAVCCAGNAGSRPASGRGLKTARPILSFGAGAPPLQTVMPSCIRMLRTARCALQAVDCALHTCTFRLRATRCVLQLSIAYWQHQAADCAPSTFVCALLTAYCALQTCGYIG